MGVATAMVVGAVISAVGSWFSGRSKRKAEEAMQRRQFEHDRLTQQTQREDQLRDRRYSEEAIGGYRRWGRPGLPSPAYTDPKQGQQGAAINGNRIAPVMSVRR